MVIIALLIGGLLGPLSRQVEQSQVNSTQRQLEEIRESLLGYAVIYKRLPCPDSTGDGLEDRIAAGANTGACSNVIGTFPWASLNMSEGDAWNNRFGYRVSDEFSVASDTSPRPSSVLYGLSYAAATSGAIVINQRNADKSKTTLAGGAGANPPGATAIVWSFGKNGYGATQAGGTVRPGAPAANVDETANATTNPNAALAAGASFALAFIVRNSKDAANTCSDTTGTSEMCEFDDQLVWVSAHTLISRMVVANRMP